METIVFNFEKLIVYQKRTLSSLCIPCYENFQSMRDSHYAINLEERQFLYYQI